MFSGATDSVLLFLWVFLVVQGPLELRNVNKIECLEEGR